MLTEYLTIFNLVITSCLYGVPPRDCVNKRIECVEKAREKQVELGGILPVHSIVVERRTEIKNDIEKCLEIKK